MKVLKTIVAATLVAATVAPSLAEARGPRGSYHHRSGVRIGLAIGVPLAAAAYYAPRYYAPRYYAPAYYPAPVYYPPPVTYYAPPATYSPPVTYYEQPAQFQSYSQGYGTSQPQYAQPAQPVQQQYAPSGYAEVPQALMRKDQEPVLDPQAGAFWYFCAASNGYYPHVQACPAGWQKVPPAPPPR